VTFKKPRGKIVHFVVRGANGTPDEILPAEYAPHELDFMGQLRAEMEAAAPGSPERKAALNSIATLHELKALFDAEFKDLPQPRRTAKQSGLPTPDTRSAGAAGRGG
jgi:hypothetical protein